MIIRRYVPSDRERLREICVRTAWAGADATGRFTDDGVWPEVFLDPYLAFEPELALVVADDDARGQAFGYCVATAHTTDFVARCRREWLPRFAARHPDVPPPRTREQEIVHLGHTPERMLRGAAAEYPAHLHIDLLPELQGRGFGRELIRTQLAVLGVLGVPGLHLEFDPENAGARGFYERLGFTELAGSSAQSPLLGIRT